jgi:histidyl-tRNA synthetase
MGTQVNAPRGMRDYTPSVKMRRERVLTIIRDSYKRQGFEEIETPVMEEYDRLHSGAGGDNEKMSFNILRRRLSEEEILNSASNPSDLVDMGLRYDLTVPLARFYATNKAALPTVFKSIQIAPVWRAERPQKGRYRQFVQCDIDIIGDPSTLAEAELLTATSTVLKSLGITDWKIRVNDRRILSAMLEKFGFNSESYELIFITLDKMDKLGRLGVISELKMIEGLPETPLACLVGYLISYKPKIAMALDFNETNILDLIPPGLDRNIIDDLLTLSSSLPETDKANLVFDPFLVRGMGYYTGLIFEIAKEGLDSSLGGGGRYDGMIGRFLNQDVPAVGISLGFERIIDLIDLPNVKQANSVALVYDSGVAISKLMEFKCLLLAQGKQVRLERKPKTMNATFDRLVEEGYTEFAYVNRDTSSLDDLRFKKLGK